MELNKINKEIAILENNLDLSNIYSDEFQQLTNGGLHPPTKKNFYLGKKSYSTLAGGEISPIKVYKNADLDKLHIVSENKGKAGVYR
jgi:hypothetical protein